MEEIIYHYETEFDLKDPTAISQWLNDSIEEEDKELGGLNFIFCDDEYLLKVNIEHLNHDYYTDIITFDYCENDLIISDLFISIDRVKDNANTFEVSFEEELHRVMVHGVMHLCGYKDKSEVEAEKMRERENHYLQKLTLSTKK